MADFLFEIGLEEVPARMIAGAEAELLRRTLALLGKERLLPEGFDPLIGAKHYSTPRRLAVYIHGVLEKQTDISEDVTGPATKIAYKDGVPTPAAEAFARKAGVAIADLKTIQTPKGEYLAATSVKPGRTAAEVIAAEMPKELAAIYWAKNMYWLSPTGQRTSGGDPVRAGKPERFVRPVLWMVCLLGDAVVPVTFGGRTAARATFGHRVLSNGEAFEIVTPDSYKAQLEGEYVLVDVEERRHRIRKALDRVMREVPSARWREDHALVDAVTHLTEWPEVLLGSFEAEYLDLPEEVLVTVMRDHQKYFAVESAGNADSSASLRKDNKTLMPYFLTVTNIALDEKNSAIIRQGNERVLRARFNDARFFWEFDQRVPLTERVKLLENVTFQKDLGSYAAKTERVLDVASRLAVITERAGFQLDREGLDTAIRLAKTDLTTEVVKEFTELQGVIGGLYASAQGFTEVVAYAIYDQYIPVNMDDRVPRSLEGAILGIADRASTIAGMFSIGLEPTGSKDPFALRRAANGIVKILAETMLPLTVSYICDAATQFSNNDKLFSGMREFFADRVSFYLREVRGYAYDVVAAVLAAGKDDVRDVVARAEAVTVARGSEDFLAVSASFKRMKNILAQAESKGIAIGGGDGTSDTHLATLALRAEATAVSGEFADSAARKDYTAALALFARLRGPVDQFFADVMVLDPDPRIAAVRLGLLHEIVSTFSTVADFSEIVVAG